MTQRMIEITSPSFIREEDLTEGTSFDNFFSRPAPLALEVGCGIGDFIEQMARRRPDWNFLAIDIYNRGCYKTCRKVDLNNLGNVRVMRIEARYLMAQFLPPASLAAIYVNCPDPWPKKRHRPRRLVNPEFLKLALHSLQPGGEFVFSSDFTDYAEDVASLFSTGAGFQNQLPTLYSHALDNYPISKYMRRFLDRGQHIYYVHYRKQPDWSAPTTLPPDIQRGFRVRWSDADHD